MDYLVVNHRKLKELAGILKTATISLFFHSVYYIHQPCSDKFQLHSLKCIFKVYPMENVVDELMILKPMNS